MRTTLTLDDDVAATLERVRERDGLTLKEIVNDALRRGFQVMEAAEASGVPFETPPTSLGRCLTGTLDDVAEALSVAEGEDFR